MITKLNEIRLLGVAIAISVIVGCSHSREKVTQDRMDNLEVALTTFQTDQGRLPTTLAELLPLTNGGGGGQETGHIKASALTDGWGKPMRYTQEGIHSWQLCSAGRDGQFGTQDDMRKTNARHRYVQVGTNAVWRDISRELVMAANADCTTVVVNGVGFCLPRMGSVNGVAFLPPVVYDGNSISVKDKGSDLGPTDPHVAEIVSWVDAHQANVIRATIGRGVPASRVLQLADMMNYRGVAVYWNVMEGNGTSDVIEWCQVTNFTLPPPLQESIDVQRPAKRSSEGADRQFKDTTEPEAGGYRH